MGKTEEWVVGDHRGACTVAKGRTGHAGAQRGDLFAWGSQERDMSWILGSGGRGGKGISGGGTRKGKLS